MKILYSDLALDSLQEIVDFLHQNWTEKEIEVLRKDISDFEIKVQENYKLFPISQYDDNVRGETLIGKKQVKILFEKSNDEIRILLFWNNKGNPHKLIEFLKENIIKCKKH